jgi:hypothetical protein
VNDPEHDDLGDSPEVGQGVAVVRTRAVQRLDIRDLEVTSPVSRLGDIVRLSGPTLCRARHLVSSVRLRRRARCVPNA